jgi:hypothetical protein
MRIDIMRRTLLILALAAACGGSSDDSGDGTGDDDSGDDGEPLAYTACDPARDLGGFTIELFDDYTAVQGKVYDGVVPGDVPVVVDEDGDCRLVRAPIYTCTPGCAGTETCGPDGVCVPYPVAISVGDVTVTGLAAAVALSPRAPTNYYSFTGELPSPGFDAGADLELTASGGDASGFALRGWGITALTTPLTAVTVERGAALAVTWTAPPAEGAAKVVLSLNVNGHGLVGQHIECVVADTGAFTIPEPLVTALIDEGLSGFPTLAITRTTADVATLEPGCVELRVQSSRTVEVVVPGLTSCSGDDDCPDGQTCQGDLTCG